MRPLLPSEVPVAAEMLARAFAADPMFAYLLPDEASRPGWLRFLMAGALALTLPDGGVATAGAVDGLVSFVRPGGWPPPRHRLFSFLVRRWRRPTMPWPTRHLRIAGGRVADTMERLHPREPHVYVQTLGVDPAHQGEGLSRHLLAPLLALADAACVPTYLETTKPKNLGLYRHFGFEVVEEVVLDGGFPPLWTMSRPPARR